MSTEDTEKSIKERTKFNKVGKQISYSEHQATQNYLNKATRNLKQGFKAEYPSYTNSNETSVTQKPTPRQESNKPHQSYKSSIETPETPAPQTKPLSKSPTPNTTLTKTIVTKNLNVASKNPVNAIAEKLINQFKGNKPIHKTKQPPTPSSSPTNKSTGKGQGGSVQISV